MNLIQPRVEIQNTDAGHWLVTIDRALSDASERMSFSVLVKKDADATLSQVEAAALQSAIDHLQRLLNAAKRFAERHRAAP